MTKLACISLCFDQSFEMSLDLEGWAGRLSFLQLTGQWTDVEMSSFRLPNLLKIY